MAKHFSTELEYWVNNTKHKTIASLNELADEKGFAILFLLLMSIPALPLPTGGVTHLFELIVMIICLELIIGRRSLWLPKKWQKRKLPKTIETKTIPFLIKIIRWFERYSRPRLAGLLKHRLFSPIIGLIVFGFTLGAFLAPPFSGLDTLPSLGVVFLSIGLILEDTAILLFGILVGLLGVLLEIGLSSIIVHQLSRLF